MATFPVLYKDAANETMRFWSILVENQGDSTLLTTESGVDGGKIITHTVVITEGKNIGKKNETTHYEQAMKQARSEWKKKYNQGYRPEHADEEIVEAESDTKEEPVTEIEDLETLRRVLENKEAQRGLVTLYTHSQSECTRNGACGMEVGMSREKDQGAVLKLFLQDGINLDIDNTLPEDYLIGNAKISAKHSGSKVGTPVKAKWTSADLSVKDAIEQMIHAEDDYYPHLLLTYLDTQHKKITILCISSEVNKQTIKTLQHDAFSVPKGNSRGIEYSRKAMNELLKRVYFTIEIDEVDLKSGQNPIDRRIQLLRNMGITPQ